MGGGCVEVQWMEHTTLLIPIGEYGPLYEMSSSLTWDSTGEECN